MDEKSYRIFNMFTKLRKIDGLNRHRLKVHGLNNLETLILLNLYRCDCLTQKDLVEKLKAPKQSVNTVVMNLKEKNFLETTMDKSDRRVKKLILTDLGKKEAEEISRPLRETNIAIYDEIGEEKLDQIDKNLTYLINILEKNLAKEDI